MPVPQTHYRVALGDYEDDDSWVVQSKKGLIWMNIPDALSSLLQRVPEADILDFSLGSEGRFYIRYIDNGQEKRKLSKYLWEEIDQDPNAELDRLTLGPDGQHWGVRVDRDGRCHTFEQVDDCGAFGHRLDSKIDGVDSFDEIEFVALGANGDWAFGVNGRVEYRGSNLLRNRITEGRKGGKTITSAALSPLDRFWFLCWNDGTIDYYLPEDMTDDADAYCQLRYSLMSKKSRPKRGPTESTVSARRPIESAVSARIPASVNSSTSLRLLDEHRDREEFSRIHKLFKRGWKHEDKAIPNVQRIFAVILPDQLERSYIAYKSRLERSRGDKGVNEKLVFHGTPRLCRLGDNDHIKNLCKRRACSLCGILEQSFSVGRAGTAPDRNFLRFGHGIYTSGVSSKADDYTNDLSNSPNRVMLVAKAALGKGKVFRRNTESLRGPPSGYDSVLGEVGPDLNYDEQVLFRDDAIRPAYIIIYES